jgi:hypothetical protein
MGWAIRRQDKRVDRRTGEQCGQQDERLSGDAGGVPVQDDQRQRQERQQDETSRP